MSIKIKVINYLQKDEIFEITISEKDRIIDIRKEIQKRSVYFSEMSYNRIGLFIFVPKELLGETEEKKTKKVLRSEKNRFDIKQKYPEKLKLSAKNDLNIFESYPYIKNNYKDLKLFFYDLGLQINTSLVNVIEYSSPIIILLLYIIKFFNIDKNEKLKLSPKNDTKIFESYPYIINNYKKITLFYYDLGIQIDTSLANIIEYGLPIIILLFYIIKYFYFDKKTKLNQIQLWTIIMIIIHYSKRVFESIFVHIQINTMEFKMFLIECLYYIIYFGLYAQKKIFEIEENLDNNIKYIFIFLFFISEINNYHCHIILRKIRLENPNNREIPKGNIFSFVYCANYFWEICSWLFISLFSSIKAIYFFTLMGSIIMILWAQEKKNFYDKMLLKKNNKINNNKKAIIPFII